MRNFQKEVRTLSRVVHKGQAYDGNDLDPLGRFLVQTTLRHFFWLDLIARQLIKKPLPNKHHDLHLLLILGLGAVEHLNLPKHTCVNAAVETTRGLRKTWAKGLINGALRNFLRSRESLTKNLSDEPTARTNHPLWMIERMQRDWGAQASAIFSANNVPGPMTLRVNRQRLTRLDYQAQLMQLEIKSVPSVLSQDGLVLEQALDVAALPGFEDGIVSVQDSGAQLAALLLDPQPGDRILDACSAPGGKTGHLLEIMPTIDLVSADVDAHRLQRVQDNLARLGQADVTQCLDLTQRQAGLGQFDRILLDAPCSASGVIRRHPDIKLLRQDSDLPALGKTQIALLNQCWQMLRLGGTLLYVTCSVFSEENVNIAQAFMAQHPEADLIPLPKVGVPLAIGVQLLPTIGAHDGFYFARFKKMGPGI